MIDHTSVNVSNFEKSKVFYASALAPLGYELLREFDGSVAGFGIDGKPDFWIGQGEINTPSVVRHTPENTPQILVLPISQPLPQRSSLTIECVHSLPG